MTRFMTVFDQRVPRAALPGVVNRPDSLMVADHANRGRRVVARLHQPPALLGLKVQAPDRPVRVTVTLGVDDLSGIRWAERLYAADEMLPSVDPSLARLLLVRSQGRTRGAVLLARRRPDGGAPTRGELSFDLAPDELDDDGLFILEIESLEGPGGELPAWVCDELAPCGTAGVRVESVAFTAAVPGETAEPRAGRVSTGFLHDPAQAGARLRTGFFVLNPDNRSPGTHPRLRFQASAGAAPRRVRRIERVDVLTDEEPDADPVRRPAKPSRPPGEPPEPAPRPSTLRRIGRAATPPGMVVAARRGADLRRRTGESLRRRRQKNPHRPENADGPDGSDHGEHSGRPGRSDRSAQTAEAEETAENTAVVSRMVDRLLAEGRLRFEAFALDGGAAPALSPVNRGGGVIDLQATSAVDGPVLVCVVHDSDESAPPGRPLRWYVRVDPAH